MVFEGMMCGIRREHLKGERLFTEKGPVLSGSFTLTRDFKASSLLLRRCQSPRGVLQSPTMIISLALQTVS